MLSCGLDVPVLQETNRHARPFRILYVGTHSARKGIRDIVETARQLRVQGAVFEIHCAGEWYSEEDRLWCNKRIRQYDLQGCVRWMGNLVGDELWREYAEALVFFFPTGHPGETFGLVILEAMANGLPVVASRWPGPMDIIEHEVTGLLCPPRDVDAYAAAILRMMRNEDERERMGTAGGNGTWADTRLTAIWLGSGAR